MPGEADDSVQGVALRRIRLFKNGDAFTPGRKLVISPRIYRNFEQVSTVGSDVSAAHRPEATFFERKHANLKPITSFGNFSLRFQLLHNLSQEINLVSGAVRKIYAIDGTPITALDEFENDQAYVAAGMEPFKKVRYRVRNIGTDENGRVYSIEELPPDQQFISDKKARQSKKPFGSSLRLEGRPRMSAKQLFGPTTKAYKIAVFVNGGQNCTKVVLNYRNCKSLDQVLALVSLSLDRRVTRLYDAASAARITGLHAISDEMVVVATSGENMRKGNYPSPNWHASGAESKRETHDKAYGLTFFPNGDAYSHGYTVAFRRSRFPSLKKVVPRQR
ncbi:hypothetical protein DFJ73DRAFT_572464 [Zopfochytrium polystomum]|nr:hypothetical protein DFJ73DRAFT_572464 [Zopfochytrium polystomum]